MADEPLECPGEHILHRANAGRIGFILAITCDGAEVERSAFNDDDNGNLLGDLWHAGAILRHNIKWLQKELTDSRQRIDQLEEQLTAAGNSNI